MVLSLLLETLFNSLVWFAVGVLPILTIVIIQNSLCKILLPVVLRSTFARRMFMVTASIGVPIHELSHAMLAVIFGHRISRISFFEFTPVHGRLGFVEHRWNQHSVYNVVGLFFIGIAPLLGAAVTIGLATTVFLPEFAYAGLTKVDDSKFLQSNNAISSATEAVWTGISYAFYSIINVRNEPLFWPWLFFTGVITFHAVPSKADLSSALRGAVVISVVLTVLTAVLDLIVPVSHLLLMYWVQSLSIMASGIVFSMPLWLVLLSIVVLERKLRT